jgi:flagellar biosynthetic protein FliQ
MNQDGVAQLAVDAMMVTVKVAMPFLAAGLVVGLLVSIFQAATQIQEATLSFIPKIIVTGAVLVIGGPWMLDQMIVYTQELYRSIPALVGS